MMHTIAAYANGFGGGAGPGVVEHHWPDEGLRACVETIRERTQKLRNLAMDAVVELIAGLKAAAAAGGTTEELGSARDFQRKAQCCLDFIEAENSSGFHAPQEAARILAESINFSRPGQNALRGGKAEPIPTAGAQRAP